MTIKWQRPIIRQLKIHWSKYFEVQFCSFIIINHQYSNSAFFGICPYDLRPVGSEGATRRVGWTRQGPVRITWWTDPLPHPPGGGGGQRATEGCEFFLKKQMFVFGQRDRQLATDVFTGFQQPVNRSLDSSCCCCSYQVAELQNKLLLAAKAVWE